MTSPWLWPIVFFLMTAQASPMQHDPGGGCRPTVLAVPPHVTIVCQGVDPQVLQPLNAVFDTTDLDLHSKIRQAEAWVRTYHAVAQVMAEAQGDDDRAREAHTLVQAGKLTEAGALLDRVLASPGDAQPERVAVYHFSRAEVFALQFQPREALPHYAAAHRAHATQPQYTYRYAVALQQQRQYTEAEPLYQATLNALRPLASTDPTTSLPAVALALNSLASLYQQTQRVPEAEVAYRKALTTYRQLAQTHPAVYLPDIATTLTNLAVLYYSVQRLPEAEVVYQKALALRRQLAQTNPTAYLPKVATTLNNLGTVYSDAHRLSEAEGAFQEALTLRRQLAQGNPAAYLPGIATTLYNLGGIYIASRRPSEAVTTFQEALTLQRQLAQTNPRAYLPDVAATLHTLAVLALGQSRPQHAAEWIGEAVTIRRTLWQQEGIREAVEPGAHGNALAQSLGIEAEILQRTGGETPAVCTRLQEAARVVSNARLAQLIHQRRQAWCGDPDHQKQR